MIQPDLLTYHCPQQRSRKYPGLRIRNSGEKKTDPTVTITESVFEFDTQKQPGFQPNKMYSQLLSFNLKDNVFNLKFIIHVEKFKFRGFLYIYVKTGSDFFLFSDPYPQPLKYSVLQIILVVAKLNIIH